MILIESLLALGHVGGGIAIVASISDWSGGSTLTSTFMIICTVSQ